MTAARQRAPVENVGSPRLRAVEFQQAFLQGVTPEDVKAIAETLLERAKCGDIQAARLVLERLIGSQPVRAWDSFDKAKRDAMMFDSF